MKPSRVEHHLAARRLRQTWMARAQDDFALKPGCSIPKQGVLDRTILNWVEVETDDEFRGVDDDSIQTIKYAPDDWLFEDVTGVMAALDHISIAESGSGKIVRPLLPSDNGPTPSAG